MNNVRPSCERLEALVPYDPKYLPAEAYLSANENPQDVPEEVRREINRRLKTMQFNRYPDPLANGLREKIAEANGLERECVLVGNGGDELLFNIALAWGGPGRTFLNLPPTFSVYEQNALLTGTEVESIPRLADYSIDEEAVLSRVAQGGVDYVIVASPNNPTGKLASEEFLLKLLDATDALVMIDEAYFEFSRMTMRPYLAQHKNLVILRTFSKAFSLAGVRLGYILGDPAIITEFVKVRQPYSVDAVSQAIAEAVYENRASFERGIVSIIEERSRLVDELRKLPEVKAYPSDANYILFKAEGAGEIWQSLYDRGILVRDFSAAEHLTDCLRVTIGSPEENERFMAALKEVLIERRRA
ncbi:histidinol-phosphate transaminase [Raoultibacter massiliensis]|uniref:Histidinol-phosphate aminotransferase n=1 Tax=Raoultibacter massiliensis TaxID=1852371 RepID=A0ABV1JCU1_9ACTN|nr:histidinol-phosphate transaminase [Raoultibacter massiliensis]